METAALQTLRIVIADDDPTIRLFFRNSLEKDAGYQVVGEAADGAEMIRTVLEQKPDVIVFDIHMPALDGLEALRRIYEQQIIAAVAITADRVGLFGETRRRASAWAGFASGLGAFSRAPQFIFREYFSSADP